MLLDAVQPSADRHRFDVADPIDPGQVAARFAQGLVQAALELLDADHHVQVALGVLLDHVADVVRLAGLLELAPSDEVLDFSDRPDGVPVRFRQSVGEIKNTEKRVA